MALLPLKILSALPPNAAGLKKPRRNFQYGRFQPDAEGRLRRGYVHRHKQPLAVERCPPSACDAQHSDATEHGGTPQPGGAPAPAASSRQTPRAPPRLPRAQRGRDGAAGSPLTREGAAPASTNLCSPRRWHGCRRRSCCPRAPPGGDRAAAAAATALLGSRRRGWRCSAGLSSEGGPARSPHSSSAGPASARPARLSRAGPPAATGARRQPPPGDGATMRRRRLCPSASSGPRRWAGAAELPCGGQRTEPPPATGAGRCRRSQQNGAPPASPPSPWRPRSAPAGRGRAGRKAARGATRFTVARGGRCCCCGGGRAARAPAAPWRAAATPRARASAGSSGPAGPGTPTLTWPGCRVSTGAQPLPAGRGGPGPAADAGGPGGGCRESTWRGPSGPAGGRAAALPLSAAGGGSRRCRALGGGPALRQASVAELSRPSPLARFLRTGAGGRRRVFII